MRQPGQVLILTLASAVLSGCVSEVPDARFGDVQSLLAPRTGQRVLWRQGAAEDDEARAAVQALLADELTVDAAVQVALLDNPGQQAVYEELGIAQADLVQAGLLANPVFGGHVRWPGTAPRAPNVELSIVEPFLDVFARPARERMARADADAAVARVADAALRLEAEVRAAFVACQAALQSQAALQRVAQAAQLAGELARRQREAGNISELDATVQAAGARQAQMDLMRGAAEVTTAREQLARLLGPTALGAPWRIAPELPPPPAGEPPLEDLETLAIEQRLDLQAARRALDSLHGQLEYASGGFITGLELGLSWEQDTDGQRVLGPAFEMQLPFGGQRQADVLRLSALERQAARRLQDLEQQARSDVRMAHARAAAARALWDGYVRDLVPLDRRLVELSQQQYDGMLIGSFTLLQARQHEILDERQAVDALRDLWLARIDLARAVGGRVPQEASAPAETPDASITPPAPAPPPAHHHHGDTP